MGGRGAFLESGGFSKYRYKVVDVVDGVKVLEPIDGREKHSLPERSDEPCTSYMCYYNLKKLNIFIRDMNYMKNIKIYSKE